MRPCKSCIELSAPSEHDTPLEIIRRDALVHFALLNEVILYDLRHGILELYGLILRAQNQVTEGFKLLR